MPIPNFSSTSRFWLPLLAVLFACYSYAGFAMADKTAAEQGAPSAKLLIQRGTITIATYSVEIADDDAERAQGLMHRRSLPDDHAMLFIYPRAQRVSMWMKNTFIPLDMLFAGPDGTITRIHQNAQPHDLTPIPGGNSVRYVLELAAGTIANKGLQIGDQLVHPSIKK